MTTRTRFTDATHFTFPASSTPDKIRVSDFLRYMEQQGHTLDEDEPHLSPRVLTCPEHGEIDAILDAIYRACCALPTVKGAHDCMAEPEKCWVFATCGRCAFKGVRTPIYAVRAPLDL